MLEQYRRHPKPRSAGIIRTLTERGDERELFRARRLATRDVRHVAAVRMRDGSAFDLVVNPADPDRS